MTYTRMLAVDSGSLSKVPNGSNACGCLCQACFAPSLLVCIAEEDQLRANSRLI